MIWCIICETALKRNLPFIFSYLTDYLHMGIKTFMLNKRKKQLVSNCADSFFKPVSAQAE